MPIGQMRGKIIGRKNRQHTVRLVAKHRLAAQRIFGVGAGALVVGGFGIHQFALHRCHLTHAIPHGFAGFLRNQGSQFTAARFDIGVKCLTDFQSLGKWARRPSRKCGARRGHGFCYFWLPGGKALPHFLTGRRVAGRKAMRARIFP